MGIRIGIVGAGKMGVSHFAIANALPDTAVVAVCDTSSYVVSLLKKYGGVQTFAHFKDMIDEARPDAVIVATPTSTHFACAQYALRRDVHIFVEKPLTLSPAESHALSELAIERRRVNQVGFHNRFIGTFREAQRLLRSGVLGKLSNVHGSAFGQVVTKEQNRTWRGSESEGGGCLHDYASHVIDLLNFLLGPPIRVHGASLRTIFSQNVDDAVSAVLAYPFDVTGILETNWSDDTYRKMTTTVTVHGTGGKLIVDRQELKVYLREPRGFEDYVEGWNVRYITGLQKPVAFYLRGEEYSAQLEAFIDAIRTSNMAHENSFASAYETDRVVDLILQANKAKG
jgi:scyllo-inositol 2-dehydrogenase (NADP+)